MLRRFARLPLRRTVHTSAHDASAGLRAHRVRVALGASAVAGTYLAWRLNTQHVALDAKPDAHPADAADHPLSVKTATSRKAVKAAISDHAHAAPDTHATEPSPFVSDSPPPSSDAADFSAPTPAAADPAGSPFLPEAGEASTKVISDEDGKAGSEDDGEGEDGGDAAAGGAYDPVTGEINWDCPCLGGMAHGPCGPQFREAFACFIHSEEEPKGIECVEKFKAMQDCFREHPEVYAEEIMDDDEEDGAPAATGPADEDVSLASPPASTDAPAPAASKVPAPATAA